IDLLQRIATVKLVELKGASVVASLQGGEVLPLIAGRKEAPKTGAGESPPRSASPPPAPAAAPPAAASAPAKPWSWRVLEVRVERSNLAMERGGPPLPIAVTLDARDLASEPDNVSAVDLHLQIGSGAIDAAGKLRLFPPAFGGAVRYTGVDVRELVPVVPSV